MPEKLDLARDRQAVAEVEIHGPEQDFRFHEQDGVWEGGPVVGLEVLEAYLGQGIAHAQIPELGGDRKAVSGVNGDRPRRSLRAADQLDGDITGQDRTGQVGRGGRLTVGRDDIGEDHLRDACAARGV